VYRVEEKVEREYERTWPDGERSPGVSRFLGAASPGDEPRAVRGVLGRPACAAGPEDPRGNVALHANVVAEPLTPGAPDWDGMAILHFRTAHDLRERFYDSDAAGRPSRRTSRSSAAGAGLFTQASGS